MRTVQATDPRDARAMLQCGAWDARAAAIAADDADAARTSLIAAWDALPIAAPIDWHAAVLAALAAVPGSCSCDGCVAEVACGNLTPRDTRGCSCSRLNNRGRQCGGDARPAATCLSHGRAYC